MFAHIILSVFFLGQALAQGTDSYFVHIPAHEATTIQWREITFVIPQDAFLEDVTLTIRDRGVFGETKMPRLPNNFRSRQHVYAYFFSSPSQKEITVTLPLNVTEYDSQRRRIFFTLIETTEKRKWTTLRTRIYAPEGLARIETAEQSGRLVLGKNPSKPEVPIKTNEFSDFGHIPYSDTAIVMDSNSGKVLFEEEADKPRSIASVTKLLTSVVCLDQGTPLSTTVTYEDAYNPGGATMDVYDSDTLTLENVLYGALIPSANNMAMTLAHTCGVSYGDFIARMNTYASEHGAVSTHVDEPTGLDSDNVSTARDLATLARSIFSSHPDIYEHAADTSTYSFATQNTHRTVSEASTNLFDGRGKYEVVGFKTGYLPPYADRTLVLKVRKIDSEKTVIVVLLGNPEYRTIFDEAYSLVDWTFNNWILQNYAS